MEDHVLFSGISRAKNRLNYIGDTLDVREDLDKEMDVAFGEDYKEKQGKTEYIGEDAILDDSRLLKLYETIMTEIIEDNAKDTQITPWSDFGMVRMKVDNDYANVRKIHKYAMEGLVLIFKDKLHMAKKSKQGDVNGLTFTYNNEDYEFRVVVKNTVNGEMVTLRKGSAKYISNGLENIGYPEKILEAIRRRIRATEGMILFIGPTGSRKSTAMINALLELQKEYKGRKNIMTVDKTVEYRIDGVVQSQIDELSGFTYDRALSLILQENPDIISVSEINDAETAKLAVGAANTGHILLSSLHVNDVLGVSSRLGMLGLDETNVSNALKLVIYHVVTPRLCDKCKEEAIVTPEELEWVERRLGQKLGTLYKVGDCEHCEQCEGTGYSGQVLLSAALDATKEYHRCVIQNNMENKGNLSTLEEMLLKTPGIAYYPVEEEVFRHLEAGNIDYKTAISIAN